MSKNTNSVISKIKSLLVEYGFVEAKLEDGSEIVIDGNIEIGDEVEVITEDGSVPAPDGVHTLEDGSEIETEEGVIVDVEGSEEESSEEMEDVDVEVNEGEIVIQINDLLDALTETFKVLKEKMEKIDSIEKVVDEVKEDFNKFKKEPASTKIKSKGEFSSHNNQLDSQVKRIMELRK